MVSRPHFGSLTSTQYVITMVRLKGLRVFGLEPNPEKWRPVIIRDEVSVEALNILLHKGWYLMDIDMEDLPHLVFHVSAEGERPEKPAGSGGFTLWPSTKGKMLQLILTRGNIHRQRAIMLEPDEKGYRDVNRHRAEIERAAEGWKIVLVFDMENRRSLALLERTEEGPN